MKSTLYMFLVLVTAGLFTACSPADRTSSSSNSSTNTARSSASESSARIIATALLASASGSAVQGSVNFIQDGDKIRVEANLTGLTPGAHGFHIHEKGDCSAPDASSAGGHFNPTGQPHAGPHDHDRHVGDFGNLEADESGKATYSQTFADLKVEGDTSIIGKAVIVHAKADDLKTQPSGNAGDRIACGVIQMK